MVYLQKKFNFVIVSFVNYCLLPLLSLDGIKSSFPWYLCQQLPERIMNALTAHPDPDAEAPAPLTVTTPRARRNERQRVQNTHARDVTAPTRAAP